MAVDGILSGTVAQTQSNKAAENKSERKVGEIGKEDFLKLLVTQLQYQDPLKPMEDKEFLGQMAQFSSLEQMQNLNSSFTTIKAFGLIGKHITANVTDSNTNETKVVQGTATGVKISGGNAFVIVGEEEVPVDNITDVTDSSIEEGNAV